MNPQATAWSQCACAADFTALSGCYGTAQEFMQCQPTHTQRKTGTNGAFNEDAFVKCQVSNDAVHHKCESIALLVRDAGLKPFARMVERCMI